MKIKHTILFFVGILSLSCQKKEASRPPNVISGMSPTCFETCCSNNEKLVKMESTSVDFMED